MINDVVAIVVSIAVVTGLFGALYLWFGVSLDRFYGAAAKDVLARWDARLAELSPYDREQVRRHPPVEVLEAIAALPSPRLRRFKLSYTRLSAR